MFRHFSKKLVYLHLWRHNSLLKTYLQKPEKLIKWLFFSSWLERTKFLSYERYFAFYSNVRVWFRSKLIRHYSQMLTFLMMPSKNKWHQLGEVFKKSTNISLCNLQSALIKMRLRRRSFLVNSARYFKTFSWQTTCGRLLLSYPQLKWIDTCYQWTICKDLQILHVTQFQSPIQFFFNEEMLKSSVRHILLLVRACGISFICNNKSNVFWNLSMRNARVNGGNIRNSTVYWDRNSRSVTYDQKPEATASEMPAQRCTICAKCPNTEFFLVCIFPY